MGLPSLRDSPIGMGQTLRSSEEERRRGGVTTGSLSLIGDD
tara:strand:+ start:1917 stop:2039 length:123 start_codon:yes stop_codon:yes gene_type:complete